MRIRKLSAICNPQSAIRSPQLKIPPSAIRHPQFDEAVKYLLGLGHETTAIKLGLANIEQLLAALGHPEQTYPSVQIAGTNGKGSTAAMLASICRAASVNTGLYTSPHLVSITERIRLDGRDITQKDFARLAGQVRAAASELEAVTGALPTFFEQVTAIALLAFSEAKVELAILETGLGGRLDATTAARAATLAITPVALDHQEYLGHTVAEIAAEKAAIIRAGASVVIAPQTEAAHDVIGARCRECRVTPRLTTGDQINVLGVDETGRLRVTFKTAYDVYENVCLSLRGRHQAVNASVAIALAETLREERGFPLTRAGIITGLETAEHAGRLEWQTGAPSLLFDGAHNAAGARALRDYLDEFVRAPLTLIFGAMADKDLDEIAAALFPAAGELILTRPANPRAATLDALRQLATRHFSHKQPNFAASPVEALRMAEQFTPPNGIICVTGSLYLIGEVQHLNRGRGAELNRGD